MGKNKGNKSSATPATQTDVSFLQCYLYVRIHHYAFIFLQKKGSASSKVDQKNAPATKESAPKGGKKGNKY